MPKQKASRSERIFRRLLRLFPFDFRWEHGREMEQDFRARHKEEQRNGGSKMSMLKLWWETLTDIARTAPREHLDMLRQDVSYALRTMRKNPGFTIIAVLTLALGIGANTAIFSVVNTIMIQPLPFKEVDRLARVYMVRNGQPPWISPRPNLFLALEERGKFFEGLAGQRFTEMTMSTPEGPERIIGMAVSRDWERTLGVRPILGRGFSAAESAEGPTSGTVLISHRLWQRRFEGSPKVLEGTVTLDRQIRSIVGVMPAGFQCPYDNDVWFPLNFALDPEGRWGVNLYARLRSDVSLEEAQAEARALSPQLARDFPLYDGMEMLLVPAREILLGDQGRATLVLLGAVGFVLLIACANLSNMMLSRMLSRRREFALRAALGAGRGRLIRQLVTENTVLSLAGALAGLALAVWGTDFLAALIPERMGRVLGGISLDATVFGFALVLGTLAGVLTGVLPSRHVAGVTPQEALRESGRTGSGTPGRVLNTLVVVQVAVALILLSGAGIFLTDLYRLSSADHGYPTAGAVSFEINMNTARYESADQRIAFLRRAQEEITALPSVRRTGAADLLPLSGGAFLASVAVDGRPVEPGEQLLVLDRLATPGLIESLGLPLLRGRAFSDLDGPDAEPVVIVSRSFAKRHWPGEDPLGRKVRNARTDEALWMSVVGVVGDAREFHEVEDAWYRPYAQDAGSPNAGTVTFVVRLARPSPGLAGDVRRTIQAIDPELPVYDFTTLEAAYVQTLAGSRINTVLVGGFALLGLLLTVLGVYGVMAYAVALGTREIGIRMALGANPGQILRGILGRGLALAGIGVLLGLAGSVALFRTVASSLSEVENNDPVLLLAVSGVLWVSALLACWIPARRAMKVDPMVALRYE